MTESTDAREASDARSPHRKDDNVPAASAGPPAPRENGAVRVLSIVSAFVGLVVINIGWFQHWPSSTQLSVTSPPPPGIPYTPQPMTSFSAPIQPQTFVEEKPPAGQDIALSTTQLHYCVAQGARLDGSEKAVDRGSQTAIARFNALVDDYNARCVRYRSRYRGAEMQAVQAHVLLWRTLLEKEGAALVGAPRSR